MLTVEQVRSLDEKVRMAVDLIDSLKKENSVLENKLDEYKQKVIQLEDVIDSFKLDQLEIEEGIKDVLSQLDKLEDQITAPAPSVPNPPSPAFQQEPFETDSTEDFLQSAVIEDVTEEPPVIDDIEAMQETEASEAERITPELEIF
ncbi:MAG: cell division protein ZapB [Spirochaetales bacterium]|nr:cell division protein ZapB [Spirochaetales bacterium]